MAQSTSLKQVIVYADENKNEPFTQWLNDLRDRQGKKRIEARLARIGQGNYGDCESVGEGILELRMFFGPGYRVYFGEDQTNIVVLLCGGDKSTQENDIKTAKKYWKEYLKDG